jgi:cell wall-associated NlpC family hydrolase
MRLHLPPTGVTGDQIASAALKYKGAGYTYGGTAAHPGDWDCSSFVSYVLGHDLGLSLPGGKWGQAGFPPGAHGPVVESYAAWRGAVTVQAPGARGDLVCFVGEGPNGHIGIVLAADQMVSALDSASGTLVSPITGYGPPGAPVVYRRVVAAAAGTAIGAAAGGGTLQPGALAAAMEVLLVVGAMAAVILAAAVLAGGAVAAGGVWAAGKVMSSG